MAAVTDFFFSGPSLRDRFIAKRDEMRENSRIRAEYNRTFRELDHMTDRDLADIGISRGDIPQISHEAARLTAKNRHEG